MSRSAGRFARIVGGGAALLLLSCADSPNDPSEPPAPIATPSELGELVRALAHDSLRGRRAASAEEQIATDYVATLLDGYGLVPAAGGSFFRDVPGYWRFIGTSTVAIDGSALTQWTDFVPTLPRSSNPTLSWDAQAVYAGNFASASQQLPPGVDVTGRAVVLDGANGPVLVSLAPESPLARAAVVLLVAGPLSDDVLAFAQGRRLLAGAALRSSVAAPVVLTITPDVAERLMGQSLVGMQPGHLGGRTSGAIQAGVEAAPMRNVVAVLPGSDAAVADEYVVVGAHLDHIGVRPAADAGTDSIYNGADDNASGSAALLVLARHFADLPARPRRSLLFIWFAAEELGLIGSEAFTHAPSIPLASISAFVNLDMLSRGGAGDIDGGGPGYLQSIGSTRRSTLLRPIADSVAGAHGMQLDYTFDAAGHEERVFCRSDQWNFARYGVPVVFFSTGVHAEYHTVDDEVERADFEKLARVTTFVGGIVGAIASRPSVLARNLSAPDPNAACQQ